MERFFIFLERFYIFWERFFIFEDEIFDFIWCNGVLHHTKNASEAFKCILPPLKKGGYIFLGLYNKFGRFRTKFRRYVYKIFGKKIITKLDPVLRKIPNEIVKHIKNCKMWVFINMIIFDKMKKIN